ncbi:hypothetical protein JCM3775_004803 [Rhodotorula graminis]
MSDVKDKKTKSGVKSEHPHHAQRQQSARPVTSSAPTRPSRPTSALATSSAAATSSTPASSTPQTGTISSPPGLASDNDTPTPAVPTKRAGLQPTSAAEPALRAPSPGTTSSSSTASTNKPHRTRSRRRREEPSGLFSAAADEESHVEGKETEGVDESGTQDLFDTPSAPILAEPPHPSTSAMPIGRTRSTAPAVVGGPTDTPAWVHGLMHDYMRQGKELAAATERIAELEGREAVHVAQVDAHERREAVLVARVAELEREAAAGRSSRIGGHDGAQTVGQGGERGERGGEEGGAGGGSGVAAALLRRNVLPSRSSSGVETIVIDDSDSSRDMSRDSDLVVLGPPARKTPSTAHRSTLCPDLSTSPDTPSPVRDAEPISRWDSTSSSLGDISVGSTAAVAGDDDRHQAAFGQDNTESYDASMSSVGDSSGEIGGASTFEESQGGASSSGSTGTAVYRDDVESDWSLRTDSQLEPSQAPQPSQLTVPATTPTAAAATPTAAAATPTAAAATSTATAPPPPAPLLDELSGLTLDSHDVEESETQESLKVRAPGAWPADWSDEEVSQYLDALETQGDISVGVSR